MEYLYSTWGTTLLLIMTMEFRIIFAISDRNHQYDTIISDVFDVKSLIRNVTPKFITLIS